MIENVELQIGEHYIIVLPDWIKTLYQLDLYQSFQRQVFLKRLVNQVHPLAVLDTCHKKQGDNKGKDAS